MRLTEKFLQGVRTDRRRDLGTDRKGLLLRLTPDRGRVTKTFRYRYKRAGVSRVVTLGEHGATLGTLSLASAYNLHAQCVDAVARGDDPAAVVAAWWAARAPAAPPSSGGPTVRDVVEEFLRVAERERRRPQQARYLLERNVLPEIGDRSAGDVRKRDIVELLDAIVDRGSPVLANRVQSLLKQAFRVAADRDLIGTVPTFPRLAIGGPERPRARVLSDAEIVQVWRGLDSLTPPDRRGKGITRPLALALKLQLLTAQRRGEIAAARWSDVVDVPAPPGTVLRAWLIPQTKSDRPHHVPLSRQAIAVLEELRTLAGDSPYWLPSATNSSAAAADRERTITRAAREVVTHLEMQSWTPHDLRRTARTGLSRLGVVDAVAERVLNHAAADRMIATYNHYAYHVEMRDALDRWGAHVQQLLEKTP